jgi:hypothetical protein
MSRLLEPVLAATCAFAGMIALTTLYSFLEDLGPAGRVQLHSYLGLEAAARYAVAAALGLLLGSEVLYAFRPKARFYEWRLALGALLGAMTGLVLLLVLGYVAQALGLVFAGSSAPIVSLCISGFLAWVGAVYFHRPRAQPSRRLRLLVLLVFIVVIALPHLRAFPAHGSLAERDAWARRRVPGYAALVHIVTSIPQVESDVGSVVAVAPTAEDRHAYGREMNGDSLRFALDVVGTRNAGVFHVRCMVMGTTAFEWSEGRWASGGRETAIPAPSLDHSQAASVTLDAERSPGAAP